MMSSVKMHKLGFYGGPQLPRQKKNFHAKRKTSTPKELTSRQKKNCHAKRINIAR